MVAAAEISAGPMFRSMLKGQRVQAGRYRPSAQIVKAYAERAGLDPVVERRLGVPPQIGGIR